MAKAKGPIIFSTTEAGNSFQRCETSWYWGSLNGRGIERPLPSAALALGSLFHFTMADWGALYAAYFQPKGTRVFPSRASGELPYISDKDAFIKSYKPDPLAIFESHFASFKADTLARYIAYNGSEMDDSEWEKSYEEPVGELGRAMVSNYVRRWGSPYPEDCTLIAPEQTIVRPVPKVYKRQPQLYIEATLDQLLADAEGMLLIRDFKTYNDRPSDYELDADDQFMTYHGIVREEWPLYRVAGVIYDGLWKRKAITPRMRDKTEDDLQYRYFALYSDEKIDNHMATLPWRLYRMYQALQRRKRYGPAVLDKSRGWAACPGCSFNDACNQLLDGDYGVWDDEAENQALEDYMKRARTPAWRVPLPELAAAA